MDRFVKRLLTVALIACMMVSMTAVLPSAASADSPINKVLCQTSYMPVALMDVSYIYATTSTANASMTSCTWYDANGAQATDKFGEGQYRLEIRVDADDGYYFSDEVTGYINNEAATVNRSGDGKYVVLVRYIDAMVWAPTVIKQPTGEELDAGSFASFDSTAMYSTGCYWTVISPDGNQTLKADEINGVFPDVTYTGDGTERFNLHNVPADMDGWMVVCNFIGAGGYETKSNKALLTVHGEKKAEAAAVTPSPVPSPKATAAPSPTPDPAPSATPVPEEHVYGDAWESDAYDHWKVCEKCGEASEKEEHNFVWAEPDKDGKLTGTCSVCGYQVTEQEEPSAGTASAAQESKTDVVNFVFIGLIAAALIALVIEIIISVKSRKRHHRKKRSRR